MCRLEKEEEKRELEEVPGGGKRGRARRFILKSKEGSWKCDCIIQLPVGATPYLAYPVRSSEYHHQPTIATGPLDLHHLSPACLRQGTSPLTHLLPRGGSLPSCQPGLASWGASWTPSWVAGRDRMTGTACARQGWWHLVAQPLAAGLRDGPIGSCPTRAATCCLLPSEHKEETSCSISTSWLSNSLQFGHAVKVETRSHGASSRGVAVEVPREVEQWANTVAGKSSWGGPGEAPDLSDGGGRRWPWLPGTRYSNNVDGW